MRGFSVTQPNVFFVRSLLGYFCRRGWTTSRPIECAGGTIPSNYPKLLNCCCRIGENLLFGLLSICLTFADLFCVFSALSTKMSIVFFRVLNNFFLCVFRVLTITFDLGQNSNTSSNCWKQVCKKSLICGMEER